MMKTLPIIGRVFFCTAKIRFLAKDLFSVSRSRYILLSLLLFDLFIFHLFISSLYIVSLLTFVLIFLRMPHFFPVSFPCDDFSVLFSVPFFPCFFSSAFLYSFSHFPPFLLCLSSIAAPCASISNLLINFSHAPLLILFACATNYITYHSKGERYAGAQGSQAAKAADPKSVLCHSSDYPVLKCGHRTAVTKREGQRSFLQCLHGPDLPTENRQGPGRLESNHFHRKGTERHL